MRIVNYIKLFLLCAFLFLAATVASGCASTDLTVQTTQARTAYTGVLQSVNVAYTEGYITSAQLRVLDPYRLAIDTALNAMQAYATSDPAQWQAAFTSFQAALADFEKNVPATQPGK